MTLQLVTTSGKNTALEVNKAVFGAEPNKQLLAQAEYVYQSNQRQGSSMVKTRGEINRTKKKWYKQKGTGGARHGARTPSIFVGGGVAHGPTGMSDWSRTLTKSQRRRSLIYALSLKAADKSLMVSEEVEKLTGKTKATAAFLTKVVGGGARILIIMDRTIDNVLRSTRNISNVLVTRADRLNVHEVLLANKILITKDAIKEIEDRLTGVVEAKAARAAVVKPAVVKGADATKRAARKVSAPARLVAKKALAASRKAAKRGEAAKAVATPVVAKSAAKPAVKAEAKPVEKKAEKTETAKVAPKTKAAPKKAAKTETKPAAKKTAVKKAK